MPRNSPATIFHQQPTTACAEAATIGRHRLRSAPRNMAVEDPHRVVLEYQSTALDRHSASYNGCPLFRMRAAPAIGHARDSTAEPDPAEPDPAELSAVPAPTTRTGFHRMARVGHPPATRQKSRSGAPPQSKGSVPVAHRTAVLRAADPCVVSCVLWTGAGLPVPLGVDVAAFAVILDARAV